MNRTMTGKLFCTTLVLGLTLALAQTAQAQIIHIESVMNGAAEVPPVPTLGTGTSDYVLDTFVNQLHFHIAYVGLTSAETAAHIHGPAGPGTNGGVMISLPLGTPKNGVVGTSLAQNAALVSTMTYANIHTVSFGGGEIRGYGVPSPMIGQAFCFGDGSNGPCPCGNSGAMGAGCDNSLATGGALLTATGHNTPDNVVLISAGELASALTIFLQGDVVIAPTNFGDGLRCIGGNLKRIGTRSASNGWAAYPIEAELSITAKSASLGDPIAAGSVRMYQAYYRDPVVTFCPNPPGNTWNVSNAVSIGW